MESILSQEAVLVTSKVTSKKRLLREIAEKASELYNVDCDKLQNALQEREDLGPTGMGNGFAIPHARIEEIEKVCGLFVKLEEPIDFDANDQKPVDLFFVLFAPKNSGADHLKALARVSRVMRDETIRKNLRSTDDITAIYLLISQSIDEVAA